MLDMRNTATATIRSSVPGSTTNPVVTTPVQVHKPLCEHVFNSISNFLNNPENAGTTNLYEIVMNEVERPMLDRVMKFTNGNQSKAAKVMGINRSTLRRMLKKHDL